MSEPERDEELFEKLRHREIPDSLFRSLWRTPHVEESDLWMSSSMREELSEREKEVLTALANGMTAEMVSDHLGISYHTTRTHIKKARFKLKAKNRVHAVYLATKTGIIQ